jgi:hypothetical protein
MPQGLQELAQDALWGSLQRGIEQTAKLAGVEPRDVASLLPMAELTACAARLGQAHGAAMRAWTIHAGQIGGLMSGVADLTVDGRPPDPSLCLERIAKKVRRDSAFSEPLLALAGEVAQWQELIDRCRARLDEGGGELARAYRRRRLRNLLAVSISTLVVVLALSLMAYVGAARTRIDAVLESADPCAVRAIAETDLSRSSSAQRRAIEERSRACDEVLARQAREREERERREAQAREEERRRAERDARCDGLAGRLVAGELSADDEALAGGGAALLRRVRDKALLPEDLGPEGPDLPCLGARGGDRVLAAFAEAAVASFWSWAPLADPSDRARDALARRSADLSERAKVMISVRALETSKRAITAGDPASIRRALRLCAFAQAIGAPMGQPCAAVSELMEMDR